LSHFRSSDFSTKSQFSTPIKNPDPGPTLPAFFSNFTALLEANLPVKISKILTNTTELFENRDWWQDGQAGVSWLTGTHIGRSWVTSGTSKSEDDDEVEKLACDHQLIMKLAAGRLRDMLWFGILEDMDKSIELLRHQLGIETLVS